MTLSITIDLEGEYFVARCPELGTLASSKEKLDALQRIFLVSTAHISYGLRNNLPIFVSSSNNEVKNG